MTTIALKGPTKADAGHPDEHSFRGIIRSVDLNADTAEARQFREYLKNPDDLDECLTFEVDLDELMKSD